MEPASAPAWEGEDEWELFNDDGFIYKRKKRRRLADDPAAVVDASKKWDPMVDPEVEEKQRKEWKRKALLKLKRKYQRELDQWELLSNTLREMQEKLTLQCREQREEGQRREGAAEETASVLGHSGVVQRTEDASGSLLDELLLQAEAQEAIICDVSNLCDVSEAMCNALEEQLKQSYFDLPIWESPHELMASLCDD